jgi:hypothetical protein
VLLVTGVYLKPGVLMRGFEEAEEWLAICRVLKRVYIVAFFLLLESLSAL